MATLQTPSINSIIPFDPRYDQTITFSYNDNSAVRNFAVIEDITDGLNGKTINHVHNESGNVHVIPSTPQPLLEAGHKYTIRISVYDADGNTSNLSDAVIFYCFTNPNFSFSNVQSETIHRNASITLNLDYGQKEGEQLKNFQYMQYSESKILLNSSKAIYSQHVMPYSFYSLENNTTYYFRAIGETQNGMLLDTGFIKINVEYEPKTLEFPFSVENNYCEGYISLSLYVKDIAYELKNDNYSFNNGMLTLTDNWLRYYDGFSAENDFSLYLEAKKLRVGKFLTSNNDVFSLSVVSVCGTYYCQLTVGDSDFRQYEPIPKAKLDKTFNSSSSVVDVSYGDNDTIVIEVKRKNGVYELKLYNKSDI